MIRGLDPDGEPGRSTPDTVAASISEEADTIIDVYEPFLLQLGFPERRPRGRVAARSAYEHLGFDYPKDRDTAQTSFF